MDDEDESWQSIVASVAAENAGKPDPDWDMYTDGLSAIIERAQAKGIPDQLIAEQFLMHCMIEALDLLIDDREYYLTDWVRSSRDIRSRCDDLLKKLVEFENPTEQPPEPGERH